MGSSVRNFRRNQGLPLRLQHQTYSRDNWSDDLLAAIDQLGYVSVGKAPTEAEVLRQEIFVGKEDLFDPGFDCNFTHIRDGVKSFHRGQEQYSRPCGWKRLALNVLGKYEDGDSWLGEGEAAWPVSYHGTSINLAKAIIQTHYKAGPRQAFGRGIYSTPDLNAALRYSKTFTSKRTEKSYHVILQNRINPKNRVCHDNYWLVPVPEGTTAAKEKEIAENSIRPYGLLLKETPDTAVGSHTCY